MIKIPAVAAAALAATLCAGSAFEAQAIAITPSNQGGETVIYDAGGNLAGLFRLTDAAVGDTITLSDVQALHTSGSAVLSILAGDPTSLPPAGFQDGEISAGGSTPALFDNVDSGLTVEALSSTSGSVFDAVFVVFDTPFAGASGTIAVFQDDVGGTDTFGVGASSVVLTQDEPDRVPVPHALALMITGLAALAAGVGRRKRG